MTNIKPNPSSRKSDPNRRQVLAGSAAVVAVSALGLPVGAQTTTTPAASGAFASLGVPHIRRDGAEKARGGAKFAAEYSYPGMVYGALVYSTIARGTITSLEAAEAEAAPGVVLVMTHENAPRLERPEPFYSSPTGMAGSSTPVMQDAEVLWNGQPVAVVLASTQEEADHAATLINVAYEESDAVTSFDVAAESAQTSFYAGRNLLIEEGDAEAALADAEVSVDLSFNTPAHNHNQIEPHAVTVLWQDGILRMHDCSQGVDLSAITIAKVFGISPAEVHLSAEYVGGGFGGKTVWQYHILAAAASQLADRPVRMALTREGVFRICGARAPTRQRVALGSNREGRLTSLIHTGTTMKIENNSMTEPFFEQSEHMYRADNMHLEIRAGTMDMLANTFMRAPGAATGTFTLEVALDELAERLAIDPIELRVRNEPDVNPTTGRKHSQRALIDAYREGARRFGWVPRSGERQGYREGEWQVGTGMAAAYYPYKRFPGGAARITLNGEGGALIETAAADMGMGTTTATAAVASERLGIPYEAIEVRHGDNTLPGALIAAASQQTAAIGASLTAAHEVLLAELVSLVPATSPLHGLPAAELGTAEGALYSLADPQQRIPLVDLVALSESGTVSAEGQGGPISEWTQDWSMHSTGAVFTEVRVNSVTGEIRVPRITAIYDCGKILNSKLAESQFRGGIIMALGMTLMEGASFDERNGRVMNPSFGSYYMPTHLDVPHIDVGWTDIPDPQAPTGARGIGEIGMSGPAAAISNAIYDATGKRARDLPIRLDALM
ncbi:xanthine dehydrogenase family protein molybdopterin-binding subunit [uncultured Roseobacter sp.]|uniref:xanthine dehydrogenase family protein molybdopterin-binding subunit n=1 Tax=uncultured Roseobacter sp. TaxID=114847 RepID=UPI0026228756|nr:xanthine dehydrogenase family protein molybdopterin-binding subunit [uncultured Roseobacter sp.]